MKQARVEELMLTQQEVVFARGADMLEQTIEVMIERPAGRDIEDGWVARSHGKPPISIQQCSCKATNRFISANLST